MKTSKCLMGILLSSVLLIGSVFAGNALSQDIKDGILKKGQISVYNEIRSIGEFNGNTNRDCTDCEFDFTPYGSECCDSAWDEFGIDCMTLEANYNWDCSGCLCPGDGEAVCGDGFCSGDETYETCPSDCNAPGECDAGQILDCDGSDECWPESWIGDGFADCQDQQYGADLTCYDCDGGDCPESDPGCGGTAECGDGYCNGDETEESCPEDCSGGTDGGTEGCTDCEFDWTAYGSECCDTAWDEFGIDCATLESTYGWDCAGCSCPGDGDPVCGDGSCNGDETYETCPDDCNAPGECDDGFITDCVDDDCCPESWIGDGFEDCEDQAFGCDLTCYDNDAGRQMKLLGLSVQARYLGLLNRPVKFPEEGYEGEYIIDIAKDLKEKRGDSLQDSEDFATFIEAAEKSIFQDIKRTLEKIGLKFDRYFNEQSLYESGTLELVLNELQKKNLIFEKDGATWFRSSAVGLEKDRVVIKSTGEPTYRLPDMAYHRNKFERGYDLMVDVLGADHKDAYPDVLAGIEQLGYNPDKVTALIHQFVTLTKNGEPVKMSTRKAQYVTLDELIDEVGADVVRYFFLMRGMNTHLNFDMDLAKNESDENPVYYLQYAHARLCNILKHAKSMGYELNDNADLTPLVLKSEIQLINNLMEFPTILERTHYTLEPQSIANYLQELAGLFHSYYSKERVVTDAPAITAARLILVKSLQIVLCNGLKILGIHASERM